MSIVGQVRATAGVHQLRGRIVTLEDQLARTDASRGASPEHGAAAGAGAGGTAGTSAPELRRQLARLLREQADLLERSTMARVFSMLPSPARLRHDADRLDEIAGWDEEAAP